MKGADDMTSTATDWIVKRCSEGLHPLGYYAKPGRYCSDPADALRLSEDQALLLAHDLDQHAASKGFGDRFFATRHAKEIAPEAAESATEGRRFISLRMTWRQAAQIIALALENGTGAGKEAARAELFRMAELLDAMQEHDDEGAAT